jgi:hypothetical protein
LEGTHNYLQNKSSANLKKIAELEGQVGGDNKYPETKGTKIMRETKLLKISKKMPSWRGKLEGTINTPSEGTNNYVQNKTSKISKNRRVGGDNKYSTFCTFFFILSSIQQWTLGKGVMILAYLGQTPEVPRVDLRAKHHL